jgi:very-short-patch-repair endonuclease
MVFIIAPLIVIIATTRKRKRTYTNTNYNNKINYPTNNTKNYASTYYRKDYVMTKAETAFYEALLKCINSNYIIIPQIKITSVLTTRNQTALNKIDRKSIDFCIAQRIKIQSSPYVAYKTTILIELDDSTHSLPDRIERDNFVNKICYEAGLTLLRIPNAINYNELYQTINKYLKN